jgi:hypothetical protein
LLHFSGITFTRKIVNIGEIVPDLTWMDTTSSLTAWYPSLQNLPSCVQLIHYAIKLFKNRKKIIDLIIELSVSVMLRCRLPCRCELNIRRDAARLPSARYVCFLLLREGAQNKRLCIFMYVHVLRQIMSQNFSQIQMVGFNICLTLGKIMVSASDFTNLYFLCSTTESQSVLP